MKEIENKKDKLKSDKDLFDCKLMRTKLDENIQNFCEKFIFYPPKEEYYKATGKDKNYIISHKSTIPDLVIFNKSFNKNYCFMDANTNEYNKFPRRMFYIKFKEENFKEHKVQEKILVSKIFKDNEPFKDNFSINKKEEISKVSSELNEDIKNNKDSNELFKIHLDQENNIETIENNRKSNNNISEVNDEASNDITNETSNNSDKIKEEKNSNNIRELEKFLSNPNNIKKINDEINRLLFKKEWTVYTQSGLMVDHFDSFGLFRFLSKQINENKKLESFFICINNNTYKGDIVYICLFNSLPSLIDKSIEDKTKQLNFMNYQFLCNNINNFGNNPNLNGMNMFMMNMNNMNNMNQGNNI